MGVFAFLSRKHLNFVANRVHIIVCLLLYVRDVEILSLLVACGIPKILGKLVLFVSEREGGKECNEEVGVTRGNNFSCQ